MVYCAYCACEVDVEVDDANGFSCCVQCGRVLEDIAFSADITFQKDAGGESTVVGQFVNESGVARGIGRIHGGRVYAYQADSHEKAQQRGRHDIAHLVDQLGVRPREESIEAAHRLYKLALQRGFTRGRRTNQVAAACAYLVCRQDSKPFLLLDFSDALQVNVFTLGAVFLQLAKLLRLTEHPMFAKPVDPSLYIHRFADQLDFGQQRGAVSNTALRLVASMKRDWIQTGRRPSGICGAAIYIAAHIHGFERSIRDVVAVVHIGEHTLSKRLYEFSSTSASAFTADEFEARAAQLEAEDRARLEASAPAAAPACLPDSAGCEHLRAADPASAAAHFAHGMCRACYVDFLRDSGGVHGGADPPAYEAARRRAAGATLALPGTEGEGRAAGEEEYDQEEQGIAEAMVTALHDSQLRQFAPFLPSGAEEAAATAPPRGRKRRGAEAAAEDTAAEDTQQQQQEQQEQQPPQQQQQEQQQPPQQQEQQQEHQQQQPADAVALEGRVSEKRQRGAAPPASQLSDQTAPAAAAAADDARQAAAAAATSAGRHSQHSDQTAAAAGAAEEGEEGGSAAAAAGVAEAEAEAEGEDRLSDIEDADVDMYLAGEDEVRCKEHIWNMMNRDWLEKQAAKRAAQEAAERAVAEQQAAQEAAEAAGVAFKRGRGRPVGSKTKNHRAGGGADLPPAESAQEAAMRMLDQRRLSSKINYSALADLFADDGGGGGGGALGEPPPLAADALEGEDDDHGRGRAVTAAMRARQQRQQEEEARREAQQRAALEAQQRAAGRRAGRGSRAPPPRLDSLGPPPGKPGGGGPLSPRSGVGALARRSGLGSLRDSFRSQLTQSSLGRGGAAAAPAPSSAAKKTVRFAE